MAKPRYLPPFETFEWPPCPNFPSEGMLGTFMTGEPIIVVDGDYPAYMVHRETGYATISVVSPGILSKVVGSLQEQFATAEIVLVSDKTRKKLANEIAKLRGIAVAHIPDGYGIEDHDDFERAGIDVVEWLESSRVNNTLSCIKASDISADAAPLQENSLIGALIQKNTLVILYGESNAGKTFLALDIAAAVSLGRPWMGRPTTKGIVLYLASESPIGVQARLAAYQSYYNCKLHNVYVIAEPLNLYESEADIASVRNTIKKIERETGQKVVLIIGDTLTRLANGANENSEQMGIVLKNIDHIRSESNCTFMLIHHPGKDATRGMRGWSGLFAHCDTVISVSSRGNDGPRYVEVTKQRDLEVNGEKIGFRLEQVAIGESTAGEAITSCVVVADLLAYTATSRKSKPLGRVQAGVLKFLNGVDGTVPKADVALQLADRHDSGPVYRAIAALVATGDLREDGGLVGLLRQPM